MMSQKTATLGKALGPQEGVERDGETDRETGAEKQTRNAQ